VFKITDRTVARAIFELAVDQPVLDMPELLWKQYIDFEENEGEFERTRALYERLLEKTDHVKVWISYAHFEINVPDEEEEEQEGEEEKLSDAAKARARKVFERAYKSMKDRDLKEEVCSPLARAAERLVILITNSVSLFSTLACLLSVNMAVPKTSKPCRSRCLGELKSVALWKTVTLMRSTLIMYSRQMISRHKSSQTCSRWLKPGSRRVEKLLAAIK
jgi:hypothetical protein